jgi:two-component system, response regulator
MQEKIILLVEDNQDEVDLALRSFARNNSPHKVVVARDGQEALDFLFGAGAHAGRDLSVMPAVVLLDLKLPKVSGLDVLRRMRADARTRHVPVAILTSSEEDRDMILGYNLGANSFIVKPVDYAKLNEAIPPLEPEVQEVG